ncbi:hypothetical protein D9619_003936 [Psilocybe cf. subviscida]|uniref:Uncharacterized protein n=1 Tax=Psilocybe cf. subviscida TaxID=2480587 RepID=A0A8H5BPQ0_9AGAR|nr:hypothetical protein D9619_003936 [Psilocybe cf. subviscida]
MPELCILRVTSGNPVGISKNRAAPYISKIAVTTGRSRDRDGSRDGENNWIPLELLRALNGLQELILVGRPVAAGYENDFFAALKAGAPNLKKFTYIPSEGLRLPDLVEDVNESQDHRSGGFNIGQLESMAWHTRSFAKLDKQIIPALAASTSTLTSLSILRDKSPLPKRPSSASMFSSSSDSCTSTVITALFSLRFPKLASLTIGSMSWAPPSRAAFMSFLVRHPTIERLSLAQDNIPNAKRMRMFDSVLEREEEWVAMLSLNPDMLPALHRLQTGVFYLSAFAYAEVVALKRVKELEIVDMCFPLPSSTSSSLPVDVLKYLQKGQLECVEKFSFISGMRSEHTARLVATMVADVCPNLKSWASNYWSSSVDDNTLIAYFARFPYLEEVDVSVCNIFHYDPTKPEEEPDTDEEDEEEESDEVDEGDDDSEDEDHEDDSQAGTDGTHSESGADLVSDDDTAHPNHDNRESPTQPLVPAPICADSLVPSSDSAHVSLFKEGDFVKVRYTEALFLERIRWRGCVPLRRFTVHDGDWVPGVHTVAEGE